MSILTPKMVVGRYNRTPGSCVFFLPFTDGSGDIHNDAVGNIVVTDEGTADWTTAHACITNSAYTSGSVPTIQANKHLIALDCLEVVTGSNFNVNRFGPGSGSRRTELAAFGVLSAADGSSAVAAEFQTLTAGQICTRVFTFNNTTGVGSAYSKVGAAAAQADNTDTDITAIGTLSFTDVLTVNGNGTFIGKYYGWAVFAVDAIPSDADILAAMTLTHTNWTNGVKSLPATFVNA